MQMGEGPAEHSEEELSDPKTKYVTAPQVPQAPQAPQAPRATRLAPQIPRTSSLDSDSYAKSPLTRVGKRGTSTNPNTPINTSPGPGYASPVTISRKMSIDEILSHLADHGCVDVTSQLESKSSQYPISAGGFGDVYRGTLRDGSRVSIKCLRLQIGSNDDGEKQLKRAARELHVWSKCDHPNVLGLIGVARYRNRIAMVSPWMENGDLSHFLSRLPQVNRCVMSVEISDGVAYLHSLGIVHGDIKGANVLVSEDYTLKLTDFGNAGIRESTLQFTKTTSGPSMSVRWAAPEIIEGQIGSSFKADIYALGMTILEIISGSVPYIGTGDIAVLRKITSGVPPERPEGRIPPNNKQADLLWSLLTHCWLLEPEERPTASLVRDVMKAITPEELAQRPAY